MHTIDSGVCSSKFFLQEEFWNGRLQKYNYKYNIFHCNNCADNQPEPGILLWTYEGNKSEKVFILSAVVTNRIS